MKIGIFGGTFDPIHNVHLFVAESARQLENLDRILFVPNGNPQHRDTVQASPAHRCAMILAAIADNPNFALDETDLEPDATGFTADLLPKLHTKYPDASFTFILGADSVVNTQWRRLDEVIESLESFVIAPRAGISSDAVQRVAAALPINLRDRVRMLNLPELPESASLIRTLLTQHKSIRYLVPDPVWNYIQTKTPYNVN